MKYDFLILSSGKTEDNAMQLYKNLSEKGAKCITNADPKQRAKSLFESVSTSGNIFVLVPSEIDLEEDEQFLELLDATYIENAEIKAVFVNGNEIPEELLLYLGRRDAMDLEEAKDFNMDYLSVDHISPQNSFNAPVQNQNTEVISGNIDSIPNSIDIEQKDNQIREFLANAENVLNGQFQLNDDEAKEFMSTLTEMADTGNIDAIYWLGRFYRNGIIVEEDLVKATTLYETAANAGHPDAKEKLARMYLEGQITRKNLISGQVVTEESNPVKALNLFEESANSDNAESCRIMGVFYLDESENELERRKYNINIQPDNQKAIFYFEKGAQLDHRTCLLIVAEHYQTGQIVFKNYEKALKYWKRAAELGSLEAIRNMGLFNANGSNGAPKSEQEALMWYRKAVETYNDPQSKYNIGLIFFRNQDFSQAEYWFEQVLNSDEKQTEYGDIKYNADYVVELKRKALSELKDINPKKYMTKTEKGLMGLIKGMEFLGIGGGEPI